MQTRVQKWGNSLAVRIPKSCATETHLDQNTVVEVSVEDGRIILAPSAPAKPTLSSLLEGVNKKNCHGEIESGQAAGREAW